MTEQEYDLLTRACDAVLLDADSTVERTAICWLHVLREHPVVLRNYDYLFSDSALPAAPLSVRMLGPLRRLKAAAGGILKRFSEDQSEEWPGKLPENVDILIVSHLINASFSGAADDFYFGPVPRILASRGKRIAIVLINHTDLPPGSVRVPQDGVPRILLKGGGPQTAEIRKRMKREARVLRLKARSEGGFSRKILLGAAADAEKPHSLAALAIGECIGSLAQATQAKFLLTTYEGHAWERVAFASARRRRQGIRCIGYNQACLFRLQHALKRNLQPGYNPDHILTAGTVTCEMLSRAPALQGIPVSVLGSDRGQEREERTTPAVSRIGSNGPSCVVLPEGILSECKILFEFAFTAAHELPHVTFFWRLHPVLSFQMVFEQYPHLRNPPKNVVLSQASLDDDLAQSQWALYRGTTAVIRAIMAGLRPVYLGLKSEMSIDPLFALESWKKSILQTDDLAAIFREDLKPGIADLGSLDTAREYCRSYFSGFNPDILDALTSGKAS